MNDWRPRTSEDKKEDTPPFSRIFVVCSKHFKEEDLRKPFAEFGTIENFYMPKDHHTGESKGVAYIKYSLTSSAAAAIQRLNQKCLGDSNKPIKVMVANQKSEKDSRATNDNKYVRLFIIISPTDTEETIEEHFSSFGDLHSVYIHKNKGKFAYVIYKSFYGAAIAYEQCDRKYKAVFALPKEELKRGRDSFEQNLGSPSLSNTSLNNRDKFHDMSYRDCYSSGRPPLLDHPDISQRTVSVTVTPQLHEKYISSLFNIIPGMDDFQCTHDSYNGVTKVKISYADHNSAVCAVDRLNNFEFPSGEMVCVRWDTNPIAKAATEISLMVDTLKSALDSGTPASGLVQLADCIAQASSLIKVATAGMNDNESRFCSVKLPPIQPLATTKTVAKRCFIVCKPQPPPLPALKDVFCRFGDMIDVMTFANKTFGFVKYASERAAQEAIKTLHGATVHGVTLKVMEADEKQSMSDENNYDRKRPKMDVDSEIL